MGEALASWTHARSPAKQEAKDKIERAPMSSTTHGKAVPLPFADKNEYKKDFSNQEINQAIANAPKRSIPIEGIHAIQHSVKDDRVKEYIDYPHVIPEGQRHPVHRGIVDVPIVIHYKGKKYLHDGHHRTTAEMLLGKKEVLGRWVDLDNVKKV